MSLNTQSCLSKHRRPIQYNGWHLPCCSLKLYSNLHNAFDFTYYCTKQLLIFLLSIWLILFYLPLKQLNDLYENIRFIVYLKWLLVFGDFVFCEPFILKTSKYVRPYKIYKTYLSCQNIIKSYLNLMVTNCPVFRSSKLIAFCSDSRDISIMLKNILRVTNPINKDHEWIWLVAFDKRCGQP